MSTSFDEYMKETNRVIAEAREWGKQKELELAEKEAAIEKNICKKAIVIGIGGKKDGTNDNCI